MRKFILAGGGDANQSREVDEFFSALLPRKKFLFIPHAVAPHIWSYEKTYEWIQKPDAFKNVDIVMWKDIANKTLANLDEFDAIYIMGGNTFTMLDQLKKTHFLDLLPNFLDTGKLVYGISAGAILMGKSIAIAEIGPKGEGDTNEIGITALDGLNLLKDYTVYTHYLESEDEQLFAYSHEHHSSIIGIPEESGIYVDGKDLKVLGTKPIVILKNKEKTVYEVGKKFTLS